jgi:hypothetical protein
VLPTFAVFVWLIMRHSHPTTARASQTVEVEF